MQRELVVPWSNAIMYFMRSDSFPLHLVDSFSRLKPELHYIVPIFRKKSRFCGVSANCFSFFSALIFNLCAGEQIMLAFRADTQDQDSAHNPLPAVRANAEKPRNHKHADHAGCRSNHQKHLFPRILVCKHQGRNAKYNSQYYQYSDDISPSFIAGNMWFHSPFLSFLRQLPPV